MSLDDALEWCDQNMHNNYPIVASASAQATSGIYLPPSFLVDMQIVVPVIDEDTASRFYISSVANDGTSLSITLGYRTSVEETGTNVQGVDCAIASGIPLDLGNTASLESRTFYLAPIVVTASGNIGERLQGLYGYFVVGTCRDMQNVGVLTFSPENAKLIETRIYVIRRPDTSLSVMLNSGISKTLTSEDITLRAGDGIDFIVDTANGVVTISREAIDGDLSTQVTTKEEAIAAILSDLGSPIMRINGVSPNADGAFFIEGGDCVDVANSRNGVIVNNPCAKPCCGTSNTEDVSALLALLEEANTRLTNYYETLASTVNSIQSRLSSLLAARR